MTTATSFSVSIFKAPTSDVVRTRALLRLERTMNSLCH